MTESFCPFPSRLEGRVEKFTLDPLALSSLVSSGRLFWQDHHHQLSHSQTLPPHLSLALFVSLWFGFRAGLLRGSSQAKSQWVCIPQYRAVVGISLWSWRSLPLLPRCAALRSYASPGLRMGCTLLQVTAYSSGEVAPKGKSVCSRVQSRRLRSHTIS